MKRRTWLGIATATAYLLLAGGCGGSLQLASSAPIASGRHGILLLKTESDARLQQVIVWRPGSAPQPVGPSSDLMLTPEWSPDGKSIVVADEKGGWDDPADHEIYVMRADGTKLRALTSTSSNWWRDDEPTWSPDSRQIAFVRETVAGPFDLEVVDVRTGRVHRLAAAGGAVGHPAWGKPGIAYVSDYGRIMLLNPSTGQTTFLAHLGATRLAWSSRDELAALEPTRIVVYSSTGHVLAELPVPASAKRGCGVTWSPDGKELLLGTSQRGAGLWTATPAAKVWRRLPVALGAGNLESCAVSWR